MFLDDLLEESFMDNEINTHEEDVELESIMNEMDDLAIIECEEDDPFSAFLRVTCENTTNFNNIRNAIAMDELHYLRENGEELFMEAESEGGKSRVKKIFATIQAALDKAFQKITGIVKAILVKFDSWIDNDKGFIKHNEKSIAKLTGNESIKMKGYKFDNSKLIDNSIYNKVEGFRSVPGVKAIVNSVTKEAIDEYNKNKDSVAKSVYAHVCGKECASSQEFTKAMFNYFREGGEKVEYTKPLDPNMLRTNISTTKGTKDAAKKAYDGSKKFLAGLKKDAKQIETKVMNAAGKKEKESSAIMSSYINIYTRLINMMTTVNTIVMQEHVKAIAQRNRMYKAMLVAAINASGKSTSSKEKPNNESASFLDNVELA